MSFFRKFRCNHHWTVRVDKFFESNVERLSNLGATRFQYFGDDIKATHVVIMVCNKCGKVNKTVTRT